MDHKKVVGVFGSEIGVPFACWVLDRPLVGQRLPSYPLTKDDTVYARRPEEYDEAWLVWRFKDCGIGMSITEFMTKLNELNEKGKLTRVYIAYEDPSTDEWDFGEYDPETFDVEPNELWAEQIRKRKEAFVATYGE